MKGVGRDIYFKESSEKKLERATFYIQPEQQDQLERLKVKIRSQLREQRRGKRRQVDKSELIRLAIELLNEQDEDLLIKRLTSKS